VHGCRVLHNAEGQCFDMISRMQHIYVVWYHSTQISPPLNCWLWFFKMAINTKWWI